MLLIKSQAAKRFYRRAKRISINSGRGFSFISDYKIQFNIDERFENIRSFKCYVLKNCGLHNVVFNTTNLDDLYWFAKCVLCNQRISYYIDDFDYTCDEFIMLKALE